MGRLRAFIAHILCHVRHGVQQSIQRQTTLNHFRACIVGGLLFRCPPDRFPFCRETAVHSCVKSCTVVLATGKYRSRLRRTASISSGTLRPLRETQEPCGHIPVHCMLNSCTLRG